MAHMAHMPQSCWKLRVLLTSFDIRNSRNNCCLSSAIMGWSAPLPAFQTQTFWYTWYALPLCRVWSGRGTVAYWWNMIYLRSSLCTVWHSQPPRTGEVCREHDLLYVSFSNSRHFGAFFGWIVIYWNCGPVQVVGLRGHVWKPSFGKSCFSDPQNPTLKRTWPKSRHTHCGQKQGMGSVKPEWKFWAFHQVGWFGVLKKKLVLDTKSVLHPNNIFYMSLHPQTHFPCRL